MTNSPAAVFDRVVTASPPERPEILLGTACVAGGGIAGLLAARVLADHAERVIVIERDPAGEHPSVPQMRHLHLLNPGGRNWIDRWLPGFSQEMLDGGAVFVTPQRRRNYQDGRQVVVGPYDFVGASRMFIEDTIRSRVEALPNVSVRRAQVTGLAFADDEARGVRVTAEGRAEVIAADFVADATGRGGRLADWLTEGSYERPTLERLTAPINYATAVFERAQDARDLPLAIVSARNNPPYSAGQLAVGVVKAIEGDRWLMTLMGYDNMRPARTIEEFRAACAPLPPLFAAVAAGTQIGAVEVYRQAESRRRDFTGLGHLPGRLVSVGDAVASFNPVYGQGMTSAALHASCLSQYLRTGPDPRSTAGFFDLQRVVVDAAWSISVGGDAARLDAQAGVVPPSEVRLQREAMSQLLRALTSDTEVAKVVEPVMAMLAHPATLSDPALIARATAANKREASAA